jgi:DNA polymerase III alpha subunit
LNSLKHAKPGRGSAAGSLVAYALGITGLDPIEHGLLFERFLNPARISMPDLIWSLMSVAAAR